MRFLIRSADFKDIKDLLDLTSYFPLCSLPGDSSELEKKIQISKESFDQKIPKENRNYVFVMEDKKENKVIGSSQILSYFGNRRSICYSIKKEGKEKFLNIHPVRSGRNQIGGLILNPEYRKSNLLLGLQIGIVRFLYIKSWPKNFSKTIEVSLTAPIKKNKNHFWEETGQKYLKMDYKSALKSFQKNRAHFLSLFPKNLKIPVKNLSQKGKDYLTEVHPQTQTVYKGLLKRGFQRSNNYHLLDGGLYLEEEWKKLPFLKKAKKFLLKKQNSADPSSFLVSQQNQKGFFCYQLKAEIKNKHFLLKNLPPELEEGKECLALPFPF